MATFIVGTLVLLATALIIRKLIRDKKNGAGCSGCSGCGGGCSCHSAHKES